MKVSDFDYALPDELIAQAPLPERTQSRLLQLNTNAELVDGNIQDIVNIVRAGDVLVLNDTKVIPARLFGKKETGGKVEILLERIVDEKHFLTQIKASKSPKVGQRIFVNGVPLVMCERQGDFFLLKYLGKLPIEVFFSQVGEMPLPPYIMRETVSTDTERYQTVYAHKSGAVAAPTAGLHFDQSLLTQIAEKGVNIQKVTLHVGAGTYQPVRTNDIAQHQMHKEWVEVNQSTCGAINEAKKQGNRVIAVGTTVVRSLESAMQAKTTLRPFCGDTDIFITPGFSFSVVDVLLTNFHLPQSTLLMLVSAFSGKGEIIQAYQHAIEKKYRFFSYGDAMLLYRQNV